jgi:hypothetical protein
MGYLHPSVYQATRCTKHILEALEAPTQPKKTEGAGRIVTLTAKPKRLRCDMCGKAAVKAGDGEDSGAKAEPSGGHEKILTVDEAKPEVSAPSPSPRHVAAENVAEIADELRAATAYPFNPDWKVSNKKRYEKTVQLVSETASKLEAEVWNIRNPLTPPTGDER